MVQMVVRKGGGQNPTPLITTFGFNTLQSVPSRIRVCKNGVAATGKGKKEAREKKHISFILFVLR